uniref:Uncharacterized protein n=1 Tax=Strigamia maritima TaxID=126957 RepID=T1JJE0_STRMM
MSTLVYSQGCCSNGPTASGGMATTEAKKDAQGQTTNSIFSSNSNFFFDPTSQGTPLALLPLPEATMAEVNEKMSVGDASVVRYVQDGKPALEAEAEMSEFVSETRALHAAPTDMDVGFVCKKCQLVFVTQTQCENHQRTVCLPDCKMAEPIVRLVQVCFECRLCNEKTATLSEFKVHCDSNNHVEKCTGLFGESSSAEKNRRTDANSNAVSEVPTAGCPPTLGQGGPHAQGKWTRGAMEHQDVTKGNKQPFS